MNDKQGVMKEMEMELWTCIHIFSINGKNVFVFASQGACVMVLLWAVILTFTACECERLAYTNAALSFRLPNLPHRREAFFSLTLSRLTESDFACVSDIALDADRERVSERMRESGFLWQDAMSTQADASDAVCG